MFKKSFAEILKENLNENSFKPPDIPIQTLDPFISELKNYYIKVEDTKNIYGSRSFYKKLFKTPIKMLFYWCEEDWQGSLFVIYSYKNKYIYISGYFGSCELCDSFPDTENDLERTFNNLQITEDFSSIKLSEYSHPELIKNFDKFKNKYLKKKNINIENVEQTENTTSMSLESIKKKPESWASLFK